MNVKAYWIVLCSTIGLLHAEFCQRDDCRGGDCEINHLPNGSIKKTCHCIKGVCGENCQRLCNVTSQCETNPCWFGGTCVDVPHLDYICLCPPDHTGKDCRTLLSCHANSCQNDGTCIQTAYGARCNCPPNVRGDFCQYTDTNRTKIEARQFDPQLLASIAGLGSESANHHPPPRLHAHSVSIAVNNRSQFVFCLTNPCENGGTCFVTNVATTKGICVCQKGFVGDYCEEIHREESDIFERFEGFCSSNPCLNGGTCVEMNHIHGYCRCSGDYRGLYCETRVKNLGCNPNPCKNGGTCILLDNTQAQCLCTPVFRGATCNQFSYVPCGDATCHGIQGVCIANRCVCKTGYAGPRCDSTDFCAAYPCLNGGTCVRTNEEPFGGCSCPSEYSGPTCSNDPCNPSPCLNGGQCIRKADNQFYCQCRQKNRGVYCEQVECFPSDATVEVLDVGTVPLSSLKIGAHVRVIDDQNQLTFSPIIAFLHHELSGKALYKRIRTKNAKIELSNRHLIHRRHDGFVWAEDLVKGDEILVLSSKYHNRTSWESVTEVSEVNKDGLLAPLTEQGTIIVNHVHASCYALVKYHSVGHMALAPYRWYHRIFGRLSEGETNTPILSYANVLLNFFQNLPLARDFIF